MHNLDRAKIWAVAVIGALAPIHAALATVLGLIIVDLVSGIAAAVRLQQPVTSNKLKKTVIKLLVYELSIVLAYVVGTYLTGPSVPVLQVVTSVIGLTELRSILENLRSITGYDVFDVILQRVSANNDKSLRKPGGPGEGK